MPGIDPTTDCFIGPGKSFIAFWHDSGGWPVLTVHVNRGWFPSLQAILRIYNAYARGYAEDLRFIGDIARSF